MKIICHFKTKGGGIFKWYSFKKYSHKDDGLRKKAQTVIVFLKRNQYLTYIIYVERNHFGPEK